MAFGEVDVNYDATTGGLFYKDSANAVVKVGPAQVSATAPNATPAGSSGNSAGEFWYDTGASALKIWTGSAWAATGGGASDATPLVAGIVFGCTLSNKTATGCLAYCIGGGSNNSAFGANALRNLASGNANTALGQESLRNSTGGGCNTAIGFCSLGDNLTGSSNVAVGICALRLNADGANNVALGANTGATLTTGSQNVLIGPNVAPASTSGSCQLAIGFSATDNWLTGTSTKAIKPAAGILDCADSTGTAGQVLMSNGSNAICWASATTGVSGTYTFGTCTVVISNGLITSVS